MDKMGDGQMSISGERSKKALDRIESTLHTLLRLVEQERADIEMGTYQTAGELGYIASRLEEIESFWAQTGEYAE
jgi:hypothetical protein